MKSILLTLMLAISGFAFAEPYKEYSPQQLEALFGLQEQDGKNIVDINVPELTEMTAALERHAVSYPTRFDNKEDEKLAIRDTVYLTGVLDILSPNFANDIELLSLTLRLNNIAYNLDAQAELSNQRFLKTAQAIFQLDPDHVETHYRLGYFLAATNKTDEAIPHLQKAADNQIVNANYALAMIYLSREDFNKALEYLAIYKANSPENEQVDKLIEAIKNGEIEIEKSVTP